MKDEDKIYLKHVLESISEIENSLKVISKEEFKKNKDKQDATLRRIEVVGEAVKNVSDELKREHSEIEWKKIAGARDVLIHAYFSVDLDLVWKIIEKDLPELKEKIKKILKGGRKRKSL